MEVSDARIRFKLDTCYPKILCNSELDLFIPLFYEFSNKDLLVLQCNSQNGRKNEKKVQRVTVGNQLMMINQKNTSTSTTPENTAKLKVFMQTVEKQLIHDV